MSGGQGARQDEEPGRGGGYRDHGERDHGPVGRTMSADQQGHRPGPAERGDYSNRAESDDTRHYRSSSREGGYDYDRDPRGSRQDEGHGGWYGDRQAHSEAALRGWRNRITELRGGAVRLGSALFLPVWLYQVSLVRSSGNPSWVSAQGSRPLTP